MNTISAANVEAESYYNLLQLCRITGYANPIGALKQTKQTVSVVRDASGNIVSGNLN